MTEHGDWIQTADPAVTILSVLPDSGIPTKNKTHSHDSWHNVGSALQTEARELPAIDQRRVLAAYPSNRTRWNNNVLMLGQRPRR